MSLGGYQGKGRAAQNDYDTTSGGIHLARDINNRLSQQVQRPSVIRAINSPKYELNIDLSKITPRICRLRCINWHNQC